MKRIYNLHFIALVLTCMTLVASLYLYFSVDTHGGRQWAAYNNYRIFKHAYLHLVNGQNLYAEYVPVYWDIYKYTPSFAVFMGVFAHLPDVAGLFLWNLLNALVLLYGIYLLPLSQRKRCLILWFVSLELLTSMQGMQSNALMCGLLLIVFSKLEKGRIIDAAFLITCAAFIKGYGAAGYVLFLFYPQKGKFMIASGLSALLLFLLPLLLITPAELGDHYSSWLAMMRHDHGLSYGLSLMGLIKAWFGLELKTAIMLSGMALFLLPFLRTELYGNQQYRLRFLAMMLVWLIIFNHKAESQTYIIAITGVGIWFLAGELQASARWFLLFAFIATSVSHTDLMPFFIKKEFVYPYHIKALPMVLAWLLMMGHLLTTKKTEVQSRTFAGNSAFYE